MYERGCKGQSHPLTPFVNGGNIGQNARCRRTTEFRVTGWSQRQRQAGGKNERLRQHRIGHFRFQACGGCDARGDAVIISAFLERCNSVPVDTSSPSAGAAASSATPAAAAAAKPISRTDVEAILQKLAADVREDLDWKRSIVDLMKLLKLDSGLGARKQLAQELGYSGALDGSADMNIWLHKQVMTKLAESGGKIPDSLKA